MSACHHPKCKPHPATATHRTRRGLLLCDRHAHQWNACRAALPLVGAQPSLEEAS